MLYQHQISSTGYDELNLLRTSLLCAIIGLSICPVKIKNSSKNGE